jgi:hypothetical protein
MQLRRWGTHVGCGGSILELSRANGGSWRLVAGGHGGTMVAHGVGRQDGILRKRRRDLAAATARRPVGGVGGRVLGGEGATWETKAEDFFFFGCEAVWKLCNSGRWVITCNSTSSVFLEHILGSSLKNRVELIFGGVEWNWL